MYTKLLKTDKCDKREITRTITTTTTIKSFLRPLPQYMLAVKNPSQIYLIYSLGYEMMPRKKWNIIPGNLVCNGNHLTQFPKVKEMSFCYVMSRIGTRLKSSFFIISLTFLTGSTQILIFFVAQSLDSKLTKPNEFGSMTARKDNTRPIRDHKNRKGP